MLKKKKLTKYNTRTLIVRNIKWVVNPTKSLPNINTEAPIIIELPSLPIPMLWAKTAAKQPSPPPIIVPSPRLKPFPIVAPEVFD